MLAEWHPVGLADPVEWIVKHPTEPSPWGLIRKLRFQDGMVASTWFRAVTWSGRSEDRQLIGYSKTLEDAARAVWDHAYQERRARGGPTHTAGREASRR